MTIEKAVYTAEALSTGDGRNGHTRSTDGRVDLDLATPVEMGGSGDGANPEQLFAAGYAACFHNALKLVGKKAGADVSDSAVGAQVSIGPDGDAYGLAVKLEITLPHVDADTAEKLTDQAHQVCPYSNATRGNIDVDLAVTED
ncbi:organic hydroperoxide resistance protein [Williamsia sterculiae]|uniref:Peroxiredoxin, Ohr subfamily n=1 Tax=Williamsia sterculiae TaxID=1344003 RepID=A0A1N7GJV9_9NOCA|nr:organic hydroperoxide resistance protein [Williamsia sterculiae]SIS12885.1 peroxiredoxin, Ohr subfamily [Williamsia sterculiae]